MRTRVALRARRRRGQTLILFTLMVVIFFGFLALVVDLGFLFGQRRFDQNGADGAALAAAQIIAGNVSPNAGGAVIDLTDQAVYSIARQYAGLPASGAVPNGVNQNANLDSSNWLAVMVEYNTGDPNATWCFSRAAMSALPSPPLPAPRPSATESTCALNQRTISGQTYNFPPDPYIGAGAGAYAIRVTVSSVTSGSFSQVFYSPNGQIGPAVGSAGINAVACSRPGDSNQNPYPGMLTCAQAVAAVSGVPGGSTGSPAIPVSADYCVIQSFSGFYALWTSSVPTCNGDPNIHNWKSFIDLTPATKWCASYSYTTHLPEAGIDGQTTADSGYNPYSSVNCPYNAGWPQTYNDWVRANYRPGSYVGSDSANPDVSYWASTGFDGTLWAAPANNPVAAGGPGQFVPTYCSQSGSCGDAGNNVAQGFYCKKGFVTVAVNGERDGCQTSVNASGTFFFRQSYVTSNCYTPTTDPNLRCVMTGVPLWSNPQWDTNGGWANSGGGGPSRVQIVAVGSFRMFCDLDPNGDCTQPPSIVSPANSSSVYGYFVSMGAPQPCNPCNIPVSFTLNAIGLSQ